MSAAQHSSDPAYPAKKQGLMEETVGEDLLLYDAESHHAYRLSGRAAALWQACDGSTAVDHLLDPADREGWEVLTQLSAEGLIVPGPARLSGQGVSRRTFVRAGARVAAAAATVPLIERILVPTPAAAASGNNNNQGGNNNNQGGNQGGNG